MYQCAATLVQRQNVRVVKDDPALDQYFRLLSHVIRFNFRLGHCEADDVTPFNAVGSLAAFAVALDVSDAQRAVQLRQAELRQGTPYDAVYAPPAVISAGGQFTIVEIALPAHTLLCHENVRLTKGGLVLQSDSIMQPGTTADLYRFLFSPVFLSASFSWLIAQLLKAIIEAFRSRTRSRGSRDFAETLLWRTGGMPSSHSALVTSLATAIGFRYGLADPLFMLSLFYGILIIRDALGVRRAAGLQAQALNRLGSQLQRQQGVAFELVKEVHGHTPAEVSVGVLLGFFIAVAFSIL